MLINNPDALKSWLVVVLEPLCDADSSALARYVLALVKKDKPEKELKRMMIDQLDVFLGEETKTFVESLFSAINSEEYLNLPASTPSNVNVTANAASVAEAIGIASEASAASATSLNMENVIRASEMHQLAAAAATTQPQSASMITRTMSPNSHDLKTKETQNNTSRTHDTNSMERLTEPQITAAGEVSSSGGVGGHHHQQQQQPHHHHQAQQHHQHHHNQQHHVRSASPPARTTSTIIATNADKENQPRDSRRRRASLRSRSRSRSRSNERMLRRSRSRDRRANEREKNQRQFRNKSPPGAAEQRGHHLGGGGRRNFDRRRLGGVVGSGSGLNDDRLPRFGVGVGSSGGGGGGGGGSGGGGSGNIKGRLNRSNSPRSRSPTPDGRQRGGERHHAQALPHHQLPTLHPHDGPISISNEQRQRCRDFDEKGYCVRGETCPWDHGVNPVVFEGINNSALISMSLREYNPDAPDLWSRAGPTGGVPPPPAGVAPPTGTAGSINPFSGNVRPNTLLGGVPGGVIGAGPNNGANDYARNAAMASGGGGGPMMQFPFNPTAVTTPLQRQLVPIPVVDANSVSGGNVGGPVGVGGGEVGKRRFDLEDTVAIADAGAPPKRKPPINSRLGPRVDRANMQHNCALELRKVPRGLNTIAHLNNHFAKFGKIINIQVSYDGDPEAAIITFSAHAEANVAYRSTEAVLNNRFIKVFWHSNQENASGESTNAMGIVSGGGGSGAGGRKNTSQYHLHNVPAVPTPAADSAKIANTSQTPLGDNNTIASTNTAGIIAGIGEITPTATTALPASMRLKRVSGGPPPAPPAPGTAAIIRKKQEEQAKAVVQLANGLRKRKQELLASYVKQMKSALELVERCDPQDPQRAKTLSTIKVLQETIDKLHKEIAAEQEQLQAQMANNQQQQQQNPTLTPAATKKSKEQQKKELLDIELELFAQQQEGNDTSAIQKRLEELQRNLSISAGSGMIGSGGINAKSPHYTPGPRSAKQRATYPEGSTRVDRRPKTIVVTGFAAEDADFVLGHFKHFGEITKHDVDREIPQLILSYATRINAEQAVLRGKLFKDKRLQICWAPIVVQQHRTTNNKAAQVQVTMDKGTQDAMTEVTANSPVALFENPKQLVKSVSESESLLAGDTLPELRLEDEEEDDETEDRSWRR